MNNATYLEIFEEARWEVLEARGFGLAQIQKLGMGPVLLELRLKFIKELRLRQVVTVVTQLQSYEGTIGTMKQVIKYQYSERCCEFEMLFGVFDLRSRKIIEPTPEWKKALGL